MYRSSWILIVAVLFATICSQSCQKAATPEEKTGVVTVNGADIFYKTIGNGEETLLFVHGGPGLHHGYFLPHVENLASNYTLAFYDQRSCGQSTSPVDSSSMNMPQFVEDIDKVRTALLADKIHLVAHSWGGLPAMLYAATYPEYCKSLILVNSVSPYARPNEKEMKVLSERMTKQDSLMQQRIMSSPELKEQKSEAYEYLLKVNLKSQFKDPALLDSLHLDIPENFKDKYPYFNEMSREIATYDYREGLQNLEVPTLVICGDYDPLSMEVCPEMEALIPKASYTLIEDAGHFPFLEKPDAFAQAIRDFTSAQE